MVHDAYQHDGLPMRAHSYVSGTLSVVVLACKALPLEIGAKALTCLLYALYSKEHSHAAGGGRVARSGAC